jgi:hypothetical protein
LEPVLIGYEVRIQQWLAYIDLLFWQAFWWLNNNRFTQIISVELFQWEDYMAQRYIEILIISKILLITRGIGLGVCVQYPHAVPARVSAGSKHSEW